MRYEGGWLYEVHFDSGEYIIIKRPDSSLINVQNSLAIEASRRDDNFIITTLIVKLDDTNVKEALISFNFNHVIFIREYR